MWSWRRSEREFRALFAANPLPMWIYDLTTLQFLEVNDAAVQRYGYERDEFLAMTIKDIRPPRMSTTVTDAALPRETWQDAGNWRHRLKSGQIIDVDITSHTITFAGRSAALVVAQDITERKRSEEDIIHRAQLSALSAAVGLSLTGTASLAQRCTSAWALVTHLGAPVPESGPSTNAEGVCWVERRKSACGLRWRAAGVGIWDMDYTTGVLRWSETLEGPLRPAARNVWRDLRGVRRAHSSRRSGVRARDGWEGHEVWRRFLDTEPIDLA